MYKLRVSRGRTINRGNYESARYDVSLEEEFAENTMTYEEAYQLVTVALRRMVAAEEENVK